MPLVSTQQRVAGTREFVELLVGKNLLAPRLRVSLEGRSIEEVEQYLLSRGLTTVEELAPIYADYYHLPFHRLINRPVRPEIARLLPEEVCRRFMVLPIEQDKLHLTLAVGEPARLRRHAPRVLGELARRKGLKITLVVAPKTDLLALLEKIYLPLRAAVASAAPATTTGSLSSQPQAKESDIKGSPMSPAVTPPKPPAQVTQSIPVVSASPVIGAVSPMKPPVVPSPLEQPRGKQLTAPPSEISFKPINLTAVEIPEHILKKIPFNVAEKFQLIAFGEVKPKSIFEPPLIKVAVVDSNNQQVREMLSYIEQRNKISLDRYVTTRESFMAALKNYPEGGTITLEERPSSGESLKEVEKTAHITPEVSKTTSSSAPGSVIIPVAAVGADKIKLDDSPSGKREDDRLSPPDKGAVISVSATKLPGEQAAETQEVTEADRNLDRLLSKPIVSVVDLVEVYKGGAVPEIVAGTMFLALRMKASDIHIEAEQDSVRVRFRIDGVLHDIIQVPYFLHAPLISRIKILSKLKIDEQRIPQDGRFDVMIDKRQVDVRVSTLPTVHGEKIVMRLLDKSQGVLTLEELGVTGHNFDLLVKNIQKPYGILLVTGPTGSGKSTTLYAVLSRVSRPEVNIITLEDPVEYELPGLNQSQVKPQIGFTFAEGLRSVLRQDPNIIMVGEIRDLETAAMSTHAALTGHLVLTTLHTNDAAGALPRLINMGVEPFLITSSMNAVVGQRLVRKICDNCREPAQIPASVLAFIQKELSAMPHGQLKDVNLDQLHFYKGKGCDHCTNGYRGRIGIYEVMAMSEKIEELAVRKAPASEIKKAAIESGMITMTQDGLIKALKGITTIDEILRVTTTEIKEVPEG